MPGNIIFNRYKRSILQLCNRRGRVVINELPGGRTLVLSPHYDDDVIGMGGTILMQLERGHRVKVIYLTDGREGIPRMDDRSEVERIRKAESARALEILGVTETEHLSAPETLLRPEPRILDRLKQLLRDFAPELIFLPWFFDNHVDHIETNRLLKRIIQSSAPETLILGYEVWTPLPPNLYLDISPYARAKREALLCFASQLEQVDYMRTSLALSKRRALEMGSSGYAEAFLCFSVSRYLEWIDRTGIDRLRFITC